MEKRQRENAWIVGGGSYIASNRYASAADRVAQKLEAIHRELPNASEPTEAELEILRKRYVESEALGKRSEALWSLAKNEHRGEIFRIVVLLIYRIVVFFAACTIIYKLVLQ